MRRLLLLFLLLFSFLVSAQEVSHLKGSSSCVRSGSLRRVNSQGAIDEEQSFGDGAAGRDKEMGKPPERIRGEAALTDERGHPSSDLLKVLTTFDVCHDGSWDSIIETTQKRWIRREDVELWEIPPKDDPDPRKTYDLFTQLEMTQAIHAKRCDYDYAIVLGASAEPVRQRYQFLKEEWERGVRFNKLIVLTGDRPCVPGLDDIEGPLPQNETEMMKRLFKQMDLPAEWDAIVLFVDAPKRPGMRRPDTIDTYRKWLAMDPKPGSCLIISSQPFIFRQTSADVKLNSCPFLGSRL
ncbi:MAG: hypothetical protein K1000chlam4_01106, partial [Chlamydiae bacterium]|nr:hypothetical protein [Chlamydiota bacterium]